MRPFRWRDWLLASALLTALWLAVTYDTYRPTLSDYGAEVIGIGYTCACECERDAGADGPAGAL